jgi:hypothetical protein
VPTHLLVVASDAVAAQPGLVQFASERLTRRRPGLPKSATEKMDSGLSRRTSNPCWRRAKLTSTGICSHSLAANWKL